MIAGIKNRNFSYRILFTPETIGPIALHYLYNGFGNKVVGAYKLINECYDSVKSGDETRRVMECNSDINYREN